MRRRRFLLLGGSALATGLAPHPAFARRFLGVEEAQRLMFPGVALRRVAVTLDAAQAQAVEQASGVPVRVRELSAWRAPDGAWWLVDEVVGKHEYITWALALDPEGAVLRVEILDYRESYGGEVRNERWRAQFAGKSAADLPDFGTDVRNISGATLSCTHLTEGVRRLLATHALVLKKLVPENVPAG